MNKFRNISVTLQRKSQFKMVRVVIYSILYLFGLGDNPISNHTRDDYQSIQSDWQKVGMDIQRAMQKYEQQEKRH